MRFTVSAANRHQSLALHPGAPHSTIEHRERMSSSALQLVQASRLPSSAHRAFGDTK
jgi:hypothetical protein